MTNLSDVLQVRLPTRLLEATLVHHRHEGVDANAADRRARKHAQRGNSVRCVLGGNPCGPGSPQTDRPSSRGALPGLDACARG